MCYKYKPYDHELRPGILLSPLPTLKNFDREITGVFQYFQSSLGCTLASLTSPPKYHISNIFL